MKKLEKLESLFILMFACIDQYLSDTHHRLTLENINLLILSSALVAIRSKHMALSEVEQSNFIEQIETNEIRDFRINELELDYSLSLLTLNEFMELDNLIIDKSCTNYATKNNYKTILFTSREVNSIRNELPTNCVLKERVKHISEAIRAANEISLKTLNRHRVRLFNYDRDPDKHLELTHFEKIYTNQSSCCVLS